MEQKFKSYIIIYMIFWVLILVSLFLVKLFFYKQLNLILFYFIITWIPAILINGFEGRRLMIYARRNFSPEYADSKSLNNNERVYNGFSAFGFLFSSDDLEDETLVKYKSNYKKVVLMLILLILSYPLAFLVSILSKV